MRHLVLLLLLLTGPVGAQERPDYYVEVEVSNTRPYVGQQIRFVFRLFSRVPSWTNTGLMVEPTFDGFWLQEAETERYQAIVDGRSYEVRARNLALFPTRAGTVNIEPIRFVIPDDPFRAGDVLVTEAMTIDVQALPPPDATINFSGVVGALELLPTIDRLNTSVGDPVQLQVTLRGTGNMAQLPIPALPDSADWRSYAAPSRYQELETAQSLIGEQTFTWLLTPLEAGDLALPILDLSYFDPDTASYRSLSTSAVSIAVQPGEAAIGDVTSQDDIPLLALRPIPGSLSFSDSEVPGWTLLLWLLAPLITIGIWLRSRHLAHRRRYAALYRRSEALKKAHNMLDRAGKQSAETAYRMVSDAIMNYFADKLDQPAAILDHSAIEAAMRERQVKAEIAAHVLGSLQRSDQAQYAPFAADDSNALATQTMKILTRIDMVWQ